MTDKNNVVSVPPRRERVHYKGLHGYIEYHPNTRRWTFKLKLQHTVELEGEAATKDEAKLALKRQIEVAASGNNTKVRSID